MSADQIAPAAPTQSAPIVKAPRERLPFVPRDFDDAWRQAEVLSKADLVPKGFKGKPHDILITILTGAELGISPMQSLRNIPVINGKGFIESKLKVALCLQHPDCGGFDMVESSAVRAIFETKRKGKVTRFEFTLEDAKQAELLGKDNWRKDPRSMLRARASGQLADIVWPDVVLGVGTKEDLDESDLAKALNTAPATFAPPPPVQHEEAQVVPPTPPRQPTPEQAFQQAKNEQDLKGIPPAEPPKKRAPYEDKSTDAPMREPGADEGEEMAAPVIPPPAGRTHSSTEPESDLSLYAQVQLVDPADPDAEKKLDAIAPEAKKVQGPGRQQLGDLIKAKRAAVAAKKAGK